MDLPKKTWPLCVCRTKGPVTPHPGGWTVCAACGHPREPLSAEQVESAVARGFSGVDHREWGERRLERIEEIKAHARTQAIRWGTCPCVSCDPDNGTTGPCIKDDLLYGTTGNPPTETKEEWAHRLASDLVGAGESEYAPPGPPPKREPFFIQLDQATCDHIKKHGWPPIETNEPPVLLVAPGTVRDAAEAKARWEKAVKLETEVKIRLENVLDLITQAADATLRETSIITAGTEQKGAQMLFTELVSLGFSVRRGEKWGEAERFPMVVSW